MNRHIPQTNGIIRDNYMEMTAGIDLIILLKLKWQIIKHKIKAIKKESTLKISVILLFIIFYGIGSFWVILRSFEYINTTLGFGYFLIDRLIYVFFMVLFIMLITSQIIITYSTLYKSVEMEYLFALPLRNQTIFAAKFIETTFLSSWAFAFLAIPLFIAYGVGRELGIYFYISGICLSIPFIIVSAGIGTALGILLIRYFPKRFLKIIIIVICFIVVSIYLYYKNIRSQFNWNTGDMGLVLDQILSHTKFSLSPLLPSYWVSRGILAVISKQWPDLIFYFLTLLSSALFITWCCLQFGKKIYFTGWEMLKAGHKAKLYRPAKHLSFLDNNRLWCLIIKDFKLFRRDSVQWSQFAIFFGMIGIYIFNLRNMQYDFNSIFWKNLISYLNIGTISLTLGTLCTRFIYPQMSIECKRMWIIGLTPISIGKVLFVKYIMSVFLCSIITIGLIIASDIMLKVPQYMYWISITTVFIMSICLPGLALGIGAIFPDTKEDDMAKIVSGFGGTLTLVLSLAYIITILSLEIIPIHLYFTKQLISGREFLFWMFLVFIVLILISIITALIPLLLGFRNLKKLEV